jgi:hypothetical protein
MADKIDLITRMYVAFNARDVDAALSAMQPNVCWPNGWEGGYVNGQGAVKEYWYRQWAAINSTATPKSFEILPDGRVKAHVQTCAWDHGGNLVFDQAVDHIYSFDGELIQSMEIDHTAQAPRPLKCLPRSRSVDSRMALETWKRKRR